MSHITTGKCRLYDLDAIDQAAGVVGLELVRDQTTYKWFDNYLGDSVSGREAVRRGLKPEDMGKCKHVLRRKGHRPGDYEIGLIDALDGKGGFEPVFDEWGSGRKLAELVGGKDAPKLQDAYNQAVTYRQLARQGYRITQSKNAQGEVQLIAVKG